MSNHVRVLLQWEPFLLRYLKTLSVGTTSVELTSSRMAAWCYGPQVQIRWKGTNFGTCALVKAFPFPCVGPILWLGLRLRYMLGYMPLSLHNRRCCRALIGVFGATDVNVYFCLSLARSSAMFEFNSHGIILGLKHCRIFFLGGGWGPKYSRYDALCKITTARKARIDLLSDNYEWTNRDIKCT